jgi:hypothetical protein
MAPGQGVTLCHTWHRGTGRPVLVLASCTGTASSLELQSKHSQLYLVAGCHSRLLWRPQAMAVHQHSAWKKDMK